MRRLYCALALAAAVAAPVQAQTLRDAFEAAWLRSAAGRADTARADEANARRSAARTWVRESPSIGASYKTDRIDRNRGTHEYAVELGVPLAVPSERRANIALGDAEATAVNRLRAAARLRLAGEVREAYWAAQLARGERELAARRADEARQLAADLARRLQAGEASRVDANQARGAQLAAEAVLRAAQLEEQRAQTAFEQLTGLPLASAVAESESNAPTTLEDHPALAAVRADAAASRARADRAAQVRRSTPELIVAMTRERGDISESYGNTIRVGVRVPLGSDARNQVAIAQTGADRIEAEAAVPLALERTKAAIMLGRDELGLARLTAAAADERAQLARDNQRLIARAYALGERDLVQRLRADAERFEGELAATRAQAELGRALSRLNQALGHLP
jgi:cobalt-zinc-cadmium efflux system outer membrane protein